ncbi:MAG: nitrate reductase subunit beta [Cyanobacteria bacterium NC_groundwater_1444_Ag_S-0.65um_54_12]|nr:nitrate reductase subunit beta [Cyanobacteria bacterium NC_groundwater_1444_Ag_S-0.65um_54_12]
MDIRAQISMVFHLDKCIGCHTCSVACKNIWTDRKGMEYAWWNNVETKPGTGYPTLWEDQEKYHGGWKKSNGRLQLRSAGRAGTLGNLFFNPYLPTIDDYYEPWTYQYGELFNAPLGADQPTARPISLLTGESIDIKAGPNWDDDLGGSSIYAKNDPNLEQLSDTERAALNQLERLVFFYLPRICNHCLNPACAAACPAGAIYKRGEDGIVLLSQEKCRAWRMCISGCPYKKTYYNWGTGKSEKCILCFPRLESGQAPACFHACVGRIRYLGVLLYDAAGIDRVARASTEELVAAQRDLIKDPGDPKVQALARSNGISDQMLEAARNSPVYKFVKRWQIALPLHPEFRTLPMLFYVPPLLPVLAGINKEGNYEVAGTADGNPWPQLAALEQARVPLRYLASLFTAGNESAVQEVYRRLIAVRLAMRARNVKDVPANVLKQLLTQSGITPEEAAAISRLTATPTFEERFVIPPLAREQAIASWEDTFQHKQEAGFGFRQMPVRRF